MEGLPYDFGIEDDPDDEDGSKEKKSKKLSTSLIEALKIDHEEDKEDSVEEEAKVPSKEKLLETKEEDIDIAPELDAEAPLEHLSRVETEAIAQTIASERLLEVQEESAEPTSQTLAAESFLETVEATGDIDTAYHETLLELGETAIDHQAPAYEVKTETAEPVDPESLFQAAQSELSPDVSYKISNTSETVPKQTYKSPEKPKKKARAEKVHDGITDYVVGRRYGRIKEGSNPEEIEKKLNHEVKDITLQLASRETHIREVAQNRVYEKQPTKAKVPKVEAIGNVLVNKETQEEVKDHPIREKAGISAHTMNRSELLLVSEGIKIEGSSLRQIYEAHLVGEKGLRRIIAEYLRGGNFKRTLRHELLEKEKDFERDPKMRDQASRQSVENRSTDLNALLHKTGINWNEPQPTMTAPKKKTAKNLPAFLQEVRQPSHPLRFVADVVMVGIIAAMAITISVLLLTK